MGIHVSSNKESSLSQAVELINDDAQIVVGGVLTAREPNALIRAIVKAGKKNLHIIAGAHGFGIDLLCAGQAIGICENSFVGYEFDLGLALNYRRACEKGQVHIKETDCNILLQQFRAAQYGVPFMAMPRLAGSDLIRLHPEYLDMKCPYTGEPVTLVPAIKPDVAILHAHMADQRGNIKILGPVFKDKLLATIADTVIVSVEAIVSETAMKELQPTIPHYHVTAVVEAPFGAHPASCYPNYAYDRKHMEEFVAQSKSEETIQTYLQQYIHQPQNDLDYLTRIGGQEKLDFLQSWNQGNSQWMEVFK